MQLNAAKGADCYKPSRVTSRARQLSHPLWGLGYNPEQQAHQGQANPEKPDGEVSGQDPCTAHNDMCAQQEKHAREEREQARP